MLPSPLFPSLPFPIGRQLVNYLAASQTKDIPVGSSVRPALSINPGESIGASLRFPFPPTHTTPTHRTAMHCTARSPDLSSLPFHSPSLADRVGSLAAGVEFADSFSPHTHTYARTQGQLLRLPRLFTETAFPASIASRLPACFLSLLFICTKGEYEGVECQTKGNEALGDFAASG